MRTVLVLCVGMLLAVLCLGSVSAGSAWGPPFALGIGGTKPSVAMDANGTSYFVWWDAQTVQIQYVECTGGDGTTCGTTMILPSPGPAYYPGIALDPQQRPNVVFEAKAEGSYQVFWTRLEANGWLAPVQISHEPYSELPDLAIGPQGVIHVAYQSKQGGTGYVFYAENRGGIWSQTTKLEEASSDLPLTTFAERAAKSTANGESNSIGNGLYPRVAVDAADRAHVVWNVPAPYGVRYRFQSGGGWSRTLRVANGQKDQTPDVAVAPNGAVGIVWGTYDDANAAFAVRAGGKWVVRVNDLDGGLAQSLWPRLDVDCAGRFTFVFQGRKQPSASWNIYRRSFDPATNAFSARVTIARLSAQEQTPALAAGRRLAVVWTNTSTQIVNARVSERACD